MDRNRRIIQAGVAFALIFIGVFGLIVNTIELPRFSRDAHFEQEIGAFFESFGEEMGHFGEDMGELGEDMGEKFDKLGRDLDHKLNDSDRKVARGFMWGVMGVVRFVVNLFIVGLIVVGAFLILRRRSTKQNIDLA
jgi:hypothetical protein